MNQIQTFFAQDLRRNIIKSPKVTVLDIETGLPIEGLQDDSNPPRPLSNPFVGSPSGKVSLRAPDGEYTIRVEGIGRVYEQNFQFLDLSSVEAATQEATDAAAQAGALQSALGNDTGNDGSDIVNTGRRFFRQYLTGAGNTVASRLVGGLAVGDILEVNAYSASSRRYNAFWEMVNDSAALPGGAAVGQVSAASQGDLYVARSGAAYYRFVLRGERNVLAFGAVGDWDDGLQTGTDDTNAFLAALTVTGGVQVVVPTGDYRVTAPLDFTQFSHSLVGSGTTSCTIRIDHTDGYGVRFYRSRWLCTGVRILPSENRATNGGVDDIGFLVQGPPGFPQNAFGYIDNVIVDENPGHAFVFIASGFRFGNLQAMNNGGHAIVVDNGTIVGSPDIAFQGWCSGDTLRAYGNGGQGLVVGNPTQTPGNEVFRVEIRNLDSNNNATNPAVRYTEENNYIHANGALIENCGLGGSAGAVGALFVSGANIDVTNNRFPSALYAVRVGQLTSQTTGIDIKNMQVVSLTMNPAVIVDDTVTGTVSIDQGRTANITNLFTGPVNQWRFGNRRGMGSVSNFAALSAEIGTGNIPDDTAVILQFNGSGFGVLSLWGNSTARGSVEVSFNVGASPFCDLVSSSGAPNFVTTTGPLTGTTGVDGNITISANTDDAIYLENRSGATIAYNHLIKATAVYISSVTAV